MTYEFCVCLFHWVGEEGTIGALISTSEFAAWRLAAAGKR